MTDGNTMSSTAGLSLKTLWLLMLVLTSAVVIGRTDYFIILAFFAWLATLIKGFWIIQYFMEMKQAPLILQIFLHGWLLVTISAVTLTAIWQL
jgi:hypothetical protein